MLYKDLCEACNAINNPSPTKKDRLAVKACLNALTSGVGSRFGDFQQRILTRAIGGGTDPGVMRINLHRIHILLENFVDGGNVPDQARPLVTKYLQGWFDLVGHEREVYERFWSQQGKLADDPVFKTLPESSIALI